ncbi:MAG: hypothetical protein JO131_05975, partial [Gammaproteobacteria bacterium]|nr:hypothetical protein [Gammaproteobacteria bacterium]
MLHKKVSEEKKISEAKSPFENSATAESVTSEIVFYNNMQVFLHNFFITNNPQTNKENNHFAFLSKEHQRELFKYLEPYQELARQTLHIPSSGKSKDI